MKISTILRHIAAAGLVSASNDAYLWTVDAGKLDTDVINQVTSISSLSAERILARRIGSTQSIYLDDADDELIANLNKYGGRQRPVFGGPTQSSARMLVTVSGFQGSMPDFIATPQLQIEQPESTLLDIVAAESLVKGMCKYTIRPRAKTEVTISYIYHDSSKPCLPQKEVEVLPSVLAVTSTVPTADVLASQGATAFHHTLLRLAAEENVDSTLLVLPALSDLRRPSKAELNRRAERPLDMPLEHGPAKDEYRVLNPGKNQTLPHNIPQYFTSKAACNNQTNSCSGHGKCVQSRSDLYKCSCTATLVRDYGGGSNKTVQWGGNACQKKDVSFQFLLFAGFGIFFTAVVAGAIGMLFGMGSEELPSVIGAGVVGPRAQR